MTGGSPTALLILVASVSVKVIFFLMRSSTTTKDTAFNADDIVLWDKCIIGWTSTSNVYFVIVELKMNLRNTELRLKDNFQNITLHFMIRSLLTWVNGCISSHGVLTIRRFILSILFVSCMAKSCRIRCYQHYFNCTWGQRCKDRQ